MGLKSALGAAVSPRNSQFFLSFEAIKTCKMQEVRDFTLGIVSGHQVEDIQEF